MKKTAVTVAEGLVEKKLGPVKKEEDSELSDAAASDEDDQVRGVLCSYGVVCMLMELSRMSRRKLRRRKSDRLASGMGRRFDIW